MNELNSHIGSSVFQNPCSQFFTDDTISELVFPIENYCWSKAIMEKKLTQLTEEFGLENLLDKNIFILREQMIALASALLVNLNILLFDEWSPNLDYGKAMKLGHY